MQSNLAIRLNPTNKSFTKKLYFLNELFGRC